MGHVSNEEKATEIAIQRKKHYFDADALIINSEVECYASAIDMAKWKDEQHKQEKQKLIDKAESVCAEMFLRIESELFNAGVKNTNNRKEIEDALEIGYKYFKQAMKGE